MNHGFLVLSRESLSKDFEEAAELLAEILESTSSACLKRDENDLLSTRRELSTVSEDESDDLVELVVEDVDPVVDDVDPVVKDVDPVVEDVDPVVEDVDPVVVVELVAADDDEVEAEEDEVEDSVENEAEGASSAGKGLKQMFCFNAHAFSSFKQKPSCSVGPDFENTVSKNF